MRRCPIDRVRRRRTAPSSIGLHAEGRRSTAIARLGAGTGRVERPRPTAAQRRVRPAPVVREARRRPETEARGSGRPRVTAPGRVDEPAAARTATGTAKAHEAPTAIAEVVTVIAPAAARNATGTARALEAPTAIAAVVTAIAPAAARTATGTARALEAPTAIAAIAAPGTGRVPEDPRASVVRAKDGVDRAGTHAPAPEVASDAPGLPELPMSDPGVVHHSVTASERAGGSIRSS